jgi:tetratricopeptide (TPR) repeat protein
MKIISIESGQILAMIDKSGTFSQTKTSGSSYSNARQNLPSRESIKNSTLKDLADNLVGYFTPMFVYQSLKFEKTKVKEYKKKGKEAKKMARQGDVEGAYGIVAAIYAADPYNAEMAYNTGIINEAVGNYKKAIEAYTSATQVREDKRYVKALKRAKSADAAIQQLKALGVEVTPYSFATLSGDELVNAVEIDKVKTKGKKKDRIPAYSDPNKKSKVVANVPGDTEFEVIKREGNFVKVKLLGGKEGYFEAGSVK